jgi:hypothetical protein
LDGSCYSTNCRVNRMNFTESLWIEIILQLHGCDLGENASSFLWTYFVGLIRSIRIWLRCLHAKKRDSPETIFMSSIFNLVKGSVYTSSPIWISMLGLDLRIVETWLLSLKFSSVCFDSIGSEANAENFYRLRSREAWCALLCWWWSWSEVDEFAEAIWLLLSTAVKFVDLDDIENFCWYRRWKSWRIPPR